MNPKSVTAVFLAAICTLVLCGCNKPQPSIPAEEIKRSETPDAIEPAIKQQASGDAFAVVKEDHSSAAGTVLQDNFSIEDVNVVKLNDGGYAMMCTAFYKFKVNTTDAAMSCSDQVTVYYDGGGKRTGKYMVKNLSRK